MNATPRTRLIAAPIALAVALLALLLAVPSAIGRHSASPRAHASASFLTGVGDEKPLMFTNPLWQQLHTKIVRYIVPYDAVVHGDDMLRAHVWIEHAEAEHQQVLIAFYHSEHTPTKMPSLSTYHRDVANVVQGKPSFRSSHGAGLTRAAKVLKYMFAVAASQPRIKRLYIYDWSGGNASTRFDAGLMNAHQQPRAGYVVVCKALHATKCGVKTASN